jgi:hypothetical protein
LEKNTTKTTTKTKHTLIGSIKEMHKPIERRKLCSL